MSKKPAAIPLFADAYLADTTHLTTEEHGAYLLLLMAAWRQDDCALPDDDRKLARITGLTLRKWKAVRDTIMEFWEVESGRIFQTRLRKEHDFACKKSQQNRQAAETRWSKQAAENKQSTPMRTHSERNAPLPPPTIDTKVSKARARIKVSDLKPVGVSDQAWQDWEKVRKAKRAPITQTALDGIEREAAKAGWTLAEAINHCALKSWQGFNAEWVDKRTAEVKREPMAASDYLAFCEKQIRFHERTGNYSEEQEWRRKARAARNKLSDRGGEAAPIGQVLKLVAGNEQ